MQKDKTVVYSNIYFISQGIKLLERITDQMFTQNEGPHFKSGVGKHFRHIIDHYQSLLNCDMTQINYDERKREERLENDRLYAIQKMDDLINDLESLGNKPDIFDAELRVYSNEGIDIEIIPYSISSVRRELQFLISHTVHHYALIAMILKSIGFNLPDDFGVAPSTLNYHNERSVNTTA